MGGLPPDALDVLVRTMAHICENPYDRLFSMAMGTRIHRNGWPSWATRDSFSSRSMRLSASSASMTWSGSADGVAERAIMRSVTEQAGVHVQDALECLLTHAVELVGDEEPPRVEQVERPLLRGCTAPSPSGWLRSGWSRTGGGARLPSGECFIRRCASRCRP